jgi:predicted alpha-1,2-mannosidase
MSVGLVELVDPLVGTDSHYGFSTGNCLPICSLPFGMNHWSPQTAEGPWFFDRRARKLQGIRATHQPSPWIGDYGHFVVMATTGPLQTSPATRASAFRLEESRVKPCELRFDLQRYRCRIECAPTIRGSIFRFTFPESGVGRVYIEPCAGESWAKVDPSCNAVYGFTRGNSGGCPANFACWFVAKFDRPFTASGTLLDARSSSCDLEASGNRAGSYVEFEGGGAEPVTMRIATSFIDLEQAARNLAREIGDASYEEIAERAARVWNDNLGKIEIEDDDVTAIRTFYTCLYRTILFPRIWHEEDRNNREIHFSPYDGQVHEGPLYTDNGFWDTYRTEYPLLALLHPERLAQMLEGWTNSLKEGGWFPQWASPGYRACMVGTHVDAVMADAVVRGITNFDVQSALAGMLKHAFKPGDDAGNFGRVGIEEYEKLGYVADDVRTASVARTLDYAFDDFCIAQVAQAVGDQTSANRLRERAQSYRNVWDPKVGFMRGRNANGEWRPDFNEFRWGDPYVEGGPWQTSWSVPHDPAGLIELLGGPDRLSDRLETMLTTAPHFEVGTYRFEIHEMTEMATADFGQYAHSNQPVHHVLYMFTAAGRPWRTQYWVRRVMETLYGPHQYPGDEDNGEMSAWYVLSALGLFPLCPGHPSWVYGTPLFRKTIVHLEGKPPLVLSKEGSGIYLESVAVNGVPTDRLWIDHETVARGGELTFKSTDLPAEEPITDPERLPFSLSHQNPAKIRK